jgi:hypothetical protein
MLARAAPRAGDTVAVRSRGTVAVPNEGVPMGRIILIVLVVLLVLVVTRALLRRS